MKWTVTLSTFCVALAGCNAAGEPGGGRTFSDKAVPFTFEIPIPADVVSSYRGTYSYYSYILHVGLDISWGFDIIAQTPIEIVR